MLNPFPVPEVSSAGSVVAPSPGDTVDTTMSNRTRSALRSQAGISSSRRCYVLFIQGVFYQKVLACLPCVSFKIGF